MILSTYDMQVYVGLFGSLCLVHLCEVHLCTQAHTPIVPANHCNTTKLSTPSEARWSSFWQAEQPQHCGANSCKCSQKKALREREGERAKAEPESVCVCQAGGRVGQREREKEAAGERRRLRKMGEGKRARVSRVDNKNFQWNVIGNLIFLVPLHSSEKFEQRKSSQLCCELS